MASTKSPFSVASLCSVWLLVAISATAEEDEIVVIGVTPSQTIGFPADKVPYNVQTAVAEDMQRAQSLALSDFLNNQFGSVSINDAQNNPLQPDLQYRGYTASPLLGLAQGLAVYQNGARINEPLGDTVNWDLVPQSAIHSMNLIGGTNPVFGLNTLGGAIAIQMKNGFNTEGHRLDVSVGSFDRKVMAAQSAGNNGALGYFVSAHFFDENGWRDLSASDALNFYGSIGWLGSDSELNLNVQHGNSDLLGNGPVPVELLALDRNAIFTAPDRTENLMSMISVDGLHEFSDHLTLSANIYYRDNETDAFNGDASEFALCNLGGTARLLEGLEDDDLEALDLDANDVCDNQFVDAQSLEDFLNASAASAGLQEQFSLQDLNDELSGTGVLADEAINNISSRSQESIGADIQLEFNNRIFDKTNRFILGSAYYSGDSRFDSVTELAELDPGTRSTSGLGTGTFVGEFATSIDTRTRTLSVYFIDAIDLTDRLTFTLAGRFNDTDVELRDRSGERPELNGKHNFSRFNPALGLTYSVSAKANLYGSYSLSGRAPTPIELACNDAIFDLAVAAAVARGEDPDDVEFECRLPNAFLADPPLDDVITKSFEFGVRGSLNTIEYHLGAFRTTNTDDIIFQTTGRSTGLFANVSETRRVGVEAMLAGAAGRLDWFMAYAFLDATFEDDFTVLSPNHPFANDDGEIGVRAGSRIPGLSQHSLKLGGDYALTNKLTLGLDLRYHSDQVLRGDESNQVDRLAGYAVAALRGRYRVNDHVEFFARISNLFDTDYETFGLLGEEPSEVDVPLYADFDNPRFVGPAAPRAVFVGFSLLAQ